MNKQIDEQPNAEQQITQSDQYETKTDGLNNNGGEDFVPLFANEEKAAEETESPVDDKIEERLQLIEERERRIKRILNDLIEVIEIIKKRNKELNQKEDVLNQEYLKLIEIENMYRGVDRLTNSLDDVLPSLSAQNADTNEKINANKSDKEKREQSHE